MSALRLTLRAAPAERLDLKALTPAALAGLSSAAVGKIVVGTTKSRLTVGDVFSVSGSAGDTLVLESGSTRFDFIGAELTAGTIVVEGDAGAFAARNMRGGRVEIRGNAGDGLASGLIGGLVVVQGNAGDYLGGMRPGDRFGMAGGTVVVGGNAGDRAGDRMRRGTVIIKGRCGAAAGSRMVGGTIWALGGFGPGPGPLLRRGTLIGPSAERLLPTFVDCGEQDLNILRIFSRHLSSSLGPLAPGAIRGPVRRFAGDTAGIGKGEILLTGSGR